MKHISATALAAFLLIPAHAAFSQTGTPDCGQHGGSAEPGSIDGVIEGDQYCEYRFDAAAGQEVVVDLDSDVPFEAFLYEPVSKILPNGEPVALPQDATYTIRVGMMDAIAAENPGPQSFTFSLRLEGQGVDPDTLHSGGHISGAELAALDLGGIWEGVIPCASCPGIEVFINLDDDGTYTRTQTYLEEEDGVFQDSGDWFMTDNVIVLASDDEDEDDSFLVLDGENAMVFSDDEGKPAGAQYRLTRTSR